MKRIVHEFMSLDGVIDAPTWTFDYGFDPKMGEALGAVTGRVARHPARAQHVRDVRAGVVDPDRRGRSGRAVLQRHHEVRRVSTLTDATWRNSQIIGPYVRTDLQPRRRGVGDIYVSGSSPLIRSMLADGLIDDLHVRLPTHPGVRPAALRRRGRAQSSRARRSRSTTTTSMHLDYRPL